MNTVRLLLVVASLAAAVACSSSSTLPSRIDAEAGDSSADASRCSLPADISCFAMQSGHCSDTQAGPAAVCEAGAWVCPSGAITLDQCPCGGAIGRACSDGGADADAGSCAEATRLTCFPLRGGFCDDQGSGPSAICTAGTWSCPAGSSPPGQCPCGGVPPRCDGGALHD